MHNGHDKGQPISVNPQQAAAYALQFLDGVPHTRAQREQYDIAVSMLQAIATGQVILGVAAAFAGDARTVGNRAVKKLAALIALVSMSGCVLRIPHRDDADDDARRAPVTVLVCVFASCEFDRRPNTPTPSSGSLTGENAPNPHASRLDFGTWGKGIGPDGVR